MKHVLAGRVSECVHSAVHLFDVLLRHLCLAVLLDLLQMLHLLHMNHLVRRLLLCVDFHRRLLFDLNLIVDVAVCRQRRLIFERKTTAAVAEDGHVPSHISLQDLALFLEVALR